MSQIEETNVLTQPRDQSVLSPPSPIIKSRRRKGVTYSQKVLNFENQGHIPVQLTGNAISCIPKGDFKLSI